MRQFLLVVTASTAFAVPSFVTAAALEEIVVTAQKREESVQDVSIAITAFSGTTIEELGFRRPVDVVNQVPNVNFQGPFGDVGLPFINIRGVQLYDFGDANESSVATYVDEVYLGTAAAVTGQIFDVERVEVLRGPQGTLYGRNTTGGVMNFISRQPTEEFEARGGLQYGSFDQKIAEFSVSGPLGDRLRGRVATRWYDDRGWQKNPTLGNRHAQTEAAAIRGILDFDVTDDLMASLNVHYSDADGKNLQQGFRGAHDTSAGVGFPFVLCPEARIVANECGNLAGFIDPDPDPEEIFTDETDLTNEVEVLGANLRLNWNLGFADLTSITAYEEVDKFVREDPDAAPFQLFNFVEAYSADTEQFSQELRLSGDREGMTWVAGAFYYTDEKFVTSAFEELFGGEGSFATTEVDTLALFGQASFDLTDTVTGIVGVRYTQEDRDLVNLTSVTAPVVGTTQGDVAFTVSDSVSTNKITGKIGLEWRPAEDLMFFGSLSTGFKSPVFNTTTVTDPNRVGPVGEEELTSFEVGMKSTLWDQRMRLNLTAFYYDYEGIQIVGNAPDASGAPVSQFLNLGGADIYGFESELDVFLTDELQVMFALGLLDTKINSDPSVLVTGRPVDGNELSNSPAANFNGIVRYELPEGDLIPGKITLQTDFRWQDDVFFGPDNQTLETQDAYAVFNFRAFWESADERYKLTGFVENAFYEKYLVHVFADPGLWVGHLMWGRPRWSGIRLDVNF